MLSGSSVEMSHWGWPLKVAWPTLSHHFCFFIHAGVRYPATKPPSHPQAPPPKRKVIPGTQRPGAEMSPYDIKLDYKGLSPPSTRSAPLFLYSFQLAGNCGQRAATGRQDRALSSTQGYRSHSEGAPMAPRGLTDVMKMLFIFVTLWVGRQAQSLHVFKGIFN